jgi:oxygen-independent coproporphyrinogen III oxidase
LWLIYMTPYSIYLHIPFCIHRCAYCDFNTYAGIENLISAYVQALCREIELGAASAAEKLPVHTVFFGGGTPSLLPAAEIGRILAVIKRSYELEAGLEITLEANPGTISLDYWHEIRSLGVNRLSLGMQSANAEQLRLLERQHGLLDVLQAVEWARRAGFDNLNLDLIFGIPYQTLEMWQQTLERALALHPDHLSLYALTLEHGTPMQNWVNRGLLPQPDDDLAADMYEAATQRLGEAGFAQYEISNWARQAGNGDIFSCRHNLQYWRNLPYLGFGAGAHGYAGGVRTANVLSPAAYIKRCQEGTLLEFPRTPATLEANPIGRQAEIGETMMMGLRLTREGVSAASFEKRFGVALNEQFNQQIERLGESGLLEWGSDNPDILRLTPHGRLLGNRVFREFI